MASCSSPQQKAESDPVDSLAFFKGEKKEMKPAFSAFKMGAVMPKGWLKEQLERDVKNGLIGVTDILMASLMDDDLFVSNRRGLIPDSLKGSWRKDTDWWPGEAQGYWFDALLRNSFYANNPDNIQKVKARIDRIIASQDKDGYLGIYKTAARFSNEDGNGELWTQHRLGWALLSLFEISGDSSYYYAVKKSIDCNMQHFSATKKNPFKTELYGGASLGLNYAECVARVYEISKDVKYRDYAVWLYQAYCESAPYDNDIHFSFLKDSVSNFIGHSVHSFSHFRILLNSWFLTGAPEFEKLYQNYIAKLNRVMLPSGAAFGYENMWHLAADADSTPVEYCAITDYLLSAQQALKLTGDAQWGDRVEKIFFNAVQGCRLPDDKGVTYCKPDNCHHLTGKLLGYPKNKEGQQLGYGMKDERYKYSPAHLDVAFCCALQSARCYPYYVANMWMKTDKGFAALLHGPSVVNTTYNGIRISMEEKTNYPFDDKIIFEINPEVETEFEIIVRIPDWAKNYTFSTNVPVVRNGNYGAITKKWKKGDSFTLDLNPDIQVKTTAKNEFYLQRGCLVFALNIPSQDKKIKEWPVKGFYDQYFTTKDNFNANLAFDGDIKNNFGFAFHQQTAGTNLWINSPYFLTGSMIGLVDKKKVDVTFVPIGSTILRKTTFTLRVQNKSIK